MRPQSFIPTPETRVKDAEQWIRAVQALLSGASTLADQMSGEIKTIGWVAANAPIVVSTKLTTRPLSVMLLAAWQNAKPTTVYSGMQVIWEWDATTDGGRVKIGQLGDGSGGSTEWTAVLWIVGG